MADEEEGNLSIGCSNFSENISDIETKQAYRDQFKATQLWHAIIDYLRNNVAIKCRRQLLRNYDDTFTGANAVDVVLQFLQEKASDIACVSEDLDRQNAIKVCQALLDKHVFEPTGTWRQRNVTLRKLAFEDSHCKLFRFTSLPPDTSTPEKDSSFTRALAWSASSVKNRFTEQTEVVITNSHVSCEPAVFSTEEVIIGDGRSRFKRREGQLQSPYFQRPNLRNHVYYVSGKRSSVRASKRSTSVPPASSSSTAYTSSGAKTIKRSWATASLSTLMSRALKKKYRAKSLHDLTVPTDVWKQIALVRLLTVVEVPLLEDIIPVLQEGANDTGDFVETKKYYKFVSDEEWMMMAEKCIIGGADASSKVDSSSKLLKKKAAFSRVIRHYSKPSTAIVPDCMKDVFISILGLLQDGKEAAALQAMQWTLLLFPRERQNQLCHMLHFMHAVIDDKVRLSRKMSNRQLVLYKLVPAVFRFPLLGVEQAAILVFFMLEQCNVIFCPPVCLFDDVERVVDLSTQEVHKSVVTFCKQISDELYKLESKQESRHALLRLLHFGLRKKSATTKARKKWIHKFRKHHPDLLPEESAVLFNL